MELRVQLEPEFANDRQVSMSTNLESDDPGVFLSIPVPPPPLFHSDLIHRETPKGRHATSEFLTMSLNMPRFGVGPIEP